MHFLIPPLRADPANSALIVFFKRAAHTANLQQSYSLYSNIVFLLLCFFKILCHSDGINLTTLCFATALLHKEVHLKHLIFFDLQHCYYIRSLAELKEHFNESNRAIETDHMEQ